ncbi:hypothetical protein COO60DRAFT_1644685 [Scenedesmus sp. NREL 46B-D3]|nr:hypothetical protein COO60DRAFT_1644685 [Scenedesmus sp. NREL 46B-D3]
MISSLQLPPQLLQGLPGLPLESRLQERRLPAACPSAGCRRVVSQHDAGLLLAGTPRLRSEYLQQLQQLVAVARLTPAAAKGLSAAQRAAQLQQLARVHCRCSWHAGLSCEAYQALPASEKGESDLALFELSSSKHWRRCPSCRAMVERTDGCNYMMCRCGEPFCYACGSTFNTCYTSGCVAAVGW